MTAQTISDISTLSGLFPNLLIQPGKLSLLPKKAELFLSKKIRSDVQVWKTLLKHYKVCHLGNQLECNHLEQIYLSKHAESKLKTCTLVLNGA